jgi:cytochrome c peroxidase
MKGSAKGTLVLLCVVLLSGSCKRQEPDLIPEEFKLHAMQIEVPEGFPAIEPAEENPLTEEGVALGRLLFYDVRLSGNNRISCASCHDPALAFSDGVALSAIGASGEQLHRHAPALINLAWAKNGLFWDGGASNLESQAFAPLSSPDEMYQNLTELEHELKQVPDYVNRFKQVFQAEIKSVYVVKALTQFERTLVSAKSRYDRYQRKAPGVSFSPEESLGLSLVNLKCRSCHSGELFTDNNYHNNGLDQDFSNTQFEGLYQGRYRISYQLSDLGKYKTPTLRNVLRTAPYMHDGRLSTIEEVLDHYEHGVKTYMTTDLLLNQRDGKPGIPLSSAEKKAIIAFLGTLTEPEFGINQKMNNPFNHFKK